MRRTSVDYVTQFGRDERRFCTLYLEWL